MRKRVKPIKFEDGVLYLLDQRKLPNEEIWVECRSLEDGHNAIKDMVVRGAPCIGFTAIFTMALWLKNNDYSESNFHKACDYLNTARPTAVNLAYEVERVREKVVNGASYIDVVEFGEEQLVQSEKNNTKMAEYALEELKKKYPGKTKFNIITHCNTGSLACGSLGTAFGVIEFLNTKEMINHVWASETRPYLQGSRLTAYELSENNIEHSIVVEGAISHILRTQDVDAIFVGADRIAKNGDTANKIGTSNLSILANHYSVPFYVVAPSSSFDLGINSGEFIEIELRPEEEILNYKEHRIAPMKSRAYNPSFDITDSALITGVISEIGIANPKTDKTMERIVNA